MLLVKQKITLLIKILIVFSTTLFLVSCSKGNFYLLGKSKLTVEVKSTYTEAGYYIKDNLPVTIDGFVDTTTLGTYVLTYTADFGESKKKLTRTVNVVDTTPPVITLNGASEALSCDYDYYNEEGFTALDNFEGDLTHHVMISKIKTGFKYSVLDSSNNLTEITRLFTQVDTTAPTLTLLGPLSIKVAFNSPYYEYGFTVSDNCRFESNQVVITNSVDSSHLGHYTVTYSATDQAGNNTTLSRDVEVIDLPLTTVYLTFDDGPSPLTSQVLDILKPYGAKATFFVIKQKAEIEPILLRAYQEGNTVALHSYHHVYNTIYASTENFYEDLNRIQSWVQNITGHKSMIYRFPGGSSNISSRFNPGIMTTLTESVETKGYHYFDWNVSSGDGSSKTTTDQIITNVIKNIRPGKSYVVLMHDSRGHEETVAALPSILDYLQSIGALVLPITMDTPVVQHTVQN